MVKTAVETPVEPVPVDKNVAEEPVSANPTALEESAVTTAVGETPVEAVPPAKLAVTESVPEPGLPRVLAEYADTIESEEVVEAVNPDKDAEGVFVSAIMTVMTGIVDLLPKKLDQFVLLNLAEPVLLASIVELTDVALRWLHVM